MKRLATVLLGLGALLAQPMPFSRGTDVPAAVQRKLAPHEPAPAAPLAAWTFQRDKRLAGSGGVNPAALYRRAERELAGMRRYSTVLGRHLPLDGAPAPKSAATALGEWESLGPGNVGGRTRALVIDPTRPRIMYAAGVSGGVWKTTNSGASWRPVGDRLANLAVNSLAMDPSDSRVLYAGTGEGYFREVVRETSLPLRGGGIFKSVNGGRSWEQLPGTRGKKFHWVNDLHVSRHDADRLYAATRKGVLRSDDGGRKWKRVLRPKKTRGGCLDLVARDDTPGDQLLVSCGTLTQGTVYRHEAAEGGGRWRAVLAEAGQGRTSLAIAPSNQDVVYALASSTVPGPEGHFLQALHAVYRSDSGGAAGSWRATVTNADPRKINTLILSNPIVAMFEECNFDANNDYFSMGWYVNVIAVDPTDPDRVWAGGVDLFVSTDAGANWNPATYWWAGGGRNFVHADQHGLVFHPEDPQTLFSLNDGGIYRSTNAGAAVATEDDAICDPGASTVTWRRLNNDYGVTQFYHGTVFPGAETYMGGTQDNGSHLGTLELGNSWSRLFGGDGGYSAVDPTDLDNIYVTTQNGLIHKSTNGGFTFNQVTDGITDLATNDTGDFTAVGDNFLFISPLLIDPVSSHRLWSGGIRLWRSDNRANSWSAASTVLAGRASALALAHRDSDTMLVGTEEGTIHHGSSATSADATTDWAGSRPRRGFVSSVAFDPSDPTVVYATYAGFGGDHVWRSTDTGLSWAALDGRGPDAVPNVPVHSIAIDDRSAGARLYLGTDLGVLVSVDGGETWAVENTGFARAVTETLTIARGTDGTPYLFAFTHGRGAWRVMLE